MKRRKENEEKLTDNVTKLKVLRSSPLLVVDIADGGPTCGVPNLVHSCVGQVHHGHGHEHNDGSLHRGHGLFCFSFGAWWVVTCERIGEAVCLLATPFINLLCFLLVGALIKKVTLPPTF
jgi:hypothetical protein